MAGSKYTIQLGIEGVQQAVAGINKVRSAQMARAQTKQAERQLQNMAAAERKAAEESLPAKQRLKKLDEERVLNAKRLNELHLKLAQREARGVASPKIRHEIAARKLVNKELDRQIHKVHQLQRANSMGGRARNFFGNMARGVVGQAAAGLGLFGIGSAARGAMSDAGRLQKQSGTIGVGTDFLQEFQYGAEQKGLKADQASMGLQRFARRLAQAQQGGGELLPQLQQMGISLTDAAGRTKSTQEVMAEYADGVTRIQDPQAKLLAGFKAFDSEGAALVNVLAGGAAGLKEMSAAAHEAGAVMGSDVVGKLAAADAQLVSVGQQLKVWFAGVVASVLPFFHNVKGGLELMWKTWGHIFSAMKSAASEFISNPLGFSGEKLKGIGGAALDAIAADADRILRQRDAALGKVANNGVAGFGGGDLNAGQSAATTATAFSKPFIDSLAKIGGFRGGGNDALKQVEMMQVNQQLTKQQLRELQRIAGNTDMLK